MPASLEHGQVVHLNGLRYKLGLNDFVYWHDGVEWKEYKDGSTDVDIIDAIQDDILPFTFIRVNVSSGGASSGSASFSMQLKNN